MAIRQQGSGSPRVARSSAPSALSRLRQCGFRVSVVEADLRAQIIDDDKGATIVAASRPSRRTRAA